MADFFKTLLDYFTNNTRSRVSKLLFVIITLMSIIIVDYALDFSKNYFYFNKLDQIEKIKDLKNQYKNDSLVTAHLREMELDIAKSRHYLAFIENYKFENKETKNLDRLSEVKATKIEQKPERSFWLMFVSGGSIFFMLMVLRIIFGKGGHGTIMDSSLFLMYSIILTALLYIVPVFWNPWYNYLLNLIVQFLAILFIFVTRE